MATLPAVLVNAGPRAVEATANFFTAEKSNPNTRRAYAHAVRKFCQWCDTERLPLAQLRPYHVAAYIKEAESNLAPPSVKQHLAAIREFLDSLCRQHVLEFNPAAPVKGPRYSMKRGKTPVLMPEQARHFLASIDTTSIKGLRDMALVSVMAFSFARVGAVVKMNVEDFFRNGLRSWIRLHEKGGKFHEVPAHHRAEEAVAAYIEMAGIANDPKGPLFRTFNRRRHMTTTRMHTNDVLRMVKWHARRAGLSDRIGCHTWRATGITAFLLNHGTIEKAAAIAAHESTRTTHLYNRSNDQISLDEIERILF